MYPRLEARARHSAALGFASVAIELPGTGERPSIATIDEARSELRQTLEDGGQPDHEVVDRLVLPLVEKAVPEWRSLLDAVLALPEVGGPVGLSGGVTAVGVRLARVEPRLAAAGLFAGSFVPRSIVEEASTGHDSGAPSAPVGRPGQRQAEGLGTVRCLRVRGEDAPSEHGRPHRDSTPRCRGRGPLPPPPPSRGGEWRPVLGRLCALAVQQFRSGNAMRSRAQLVWRSLARAASGWAWANRTDILQPGRTEDPGCTGALSGRTRVSSSSTCTWVCPRALRVSIRLWPWHAR